MILVNVLLGFSQFFRAIPIMNPLPWFMIKRLMVSSENFNRNYTASLGLKNTEREDDGNDSKICYVGTHALNVSEEEIKEIDDRLSSIVRELKLHQRSF